MLPLSVAPLTGFVEPPERTDIGSGGGATGRLDSTHRARSLSPPSICSPDRETTYGQYSRNHPTTSVYSWHHRGGKDRGWLDNGRRNRRADRAATSNVSDRICTSKRSMRARRRRRSGAAHPTWGSDRYRRPRSTDRASCDGPVWTGSRTD